MSKHFFSLLAVAGLVAAGSIKDVEHIVLFMQENRAFDHYFGNQQSFIYKIPLLTSDRYYGWGPRVLRPQCRSQRRQASLVPGCKLQPLDEDRLPTSVLLEREGREVVGGNTVHGGRLEWYAIRPPRFWTRSVADSFQAGRKITVL
jgi:phospholipase C